MVGPDTSLARRRFDAARNALAAPGLAVETEPIADEQRRVLPDLEKAQGPALRVMGAYGNSRLRRPIIGSTTSTLLRRSDVPVLILR